MGAGIIMGMEYDINIHYHQVLKFLSFDRMLLLFWFECNVWPCLIRSSELNSCAKDWASVT